jgi:hypothetical protein
MKYIDTVFGNFCFNDDDNSLDILNYIKYEIKDENKEINCTEPKDLIQNVNANVYNSIRPRYSTNFKKALNNLKNIFPNKTFFHESYERNVKEYYGLCKQPNQIILDNVNHIGNKINISQDNLPKYLFLRIFMLNNCDENKIDYNNVYHVFSVVINFENNLFNKIIFLDTHTISQSIDKVLFFKSIYEMFQNKNIFKAEVSELLGNLNNPIKRRRSETELSKYIHTPFDDSIDEMWIEIKRSGVLNTHLNAIENHINNRGDLSQEEKKETIVFEQEKYKLQEQGRYKDTCKNLQRGENFIVGNNEGYCNAWSLFFLYHGMLFDNLDCLELYQLYKYIFKTLIIFTCFIACAI